MLLLDKHSSRIDADAALARPGTASGGLWHRADLAAARRSIGPDHRADDGPVIAAIATSAFCKRNGSATRVSGGRDLHV